MGLKSAFDHCLGTSLEERLSAIEDQTWSQISLATRSSKHPWCYAALSTVGELGPESRMVVIRSANRERQIIRCHTDRRTPKVRQLSQNPAIQWLMYEASTRIQVRMNGTANVLTDGAEVEAAWKATSPAARCNYLGPEIPGSVAGGPTPNLPAEFLERAPTEAESESGRENFAIIETKVTEIDWLYLKSGGHLRMRVRYQPRHELQWIEP